MEKIRDRFREATKEIIAEWHPHLTKEQLEYISTMTISLALNIKGKVYSMAIVDREAKVPQRQKLPKGYLLLEAENKNDIYLNGQIFAQEKMLNEGWVKEIKDG